MLIAVVTYFSNIIDGKGVSREIKVISCIYISLIVIIKAVNSMLCFVKLIVGYLPVF